MVQITAKAQEKFRDLLASKDSSTNIRIFVERPGTESAECGMAFCPRNMYDLADIVYQLEGFKLVVDPISDPYLDNAVVDVSDGEFTLKAPGITRNRLDPSIPLSQRIAFVIATEVNPGIATHGGAVEIVDFREESKELWVRFKGGCVGCASVGITIEDSLCRKLNQRFPEEHIVVVDKTDHSVKAADGHDGTDMGG